MKKAEDQQADPMKSPRLVTMLAWQAGFGLEIDRAGHGRGGAIVAVVRDPRSPHQGLKGGFL